MIRNDGRGNDKIRKVNITRNYIKYAEGSCLIELGNTRVVCTASVDESICGSDDPIDFQHTSLTIDKNRKLESGLIGYAWALFGDVFLDVFIPSFIIF